MYPYVMICLHLKVSTAATWIYAIRSLFFSLLLSPLVLNPLPILVIYLMLKLKQVDICRITKREAEVAPESNSEDEVRITKEEAEAALEADAGCSTYDCRITKREAEAVQREAEAAAEADEGCGWQC